jgi:hypothetical protein
LNFFFKCNYLQIGKKNQDSFFPLFKVKPI